jgi:hypothetical protein
MPDRFVIALQSIEEIRALIDSHAAAPNHATESKVKSLVSRLGVHDSYIAEKSAKVSRFTSQYFSSRKWAAHPQGAEGVRYEIIANLQRLREQLEYLAKQAAP